MRHRWILLLLLVVAAVAVLWLTALEDRAHDPTAGKVVPDSAAERAKQPTAASPSSPRPATSEGSISDAAATSTPPATPKPAPQEDMVVAAKRPGDDGLIALDGIVTAITDDGAQIEGESGQLRVLEWQEGLRKGEVQCRIRAGRFSLRVDPRSELEITSIEYAALPVSPDVERLTIPADRVLHLVVRTHRAILHVVDADTGEDLENVTVVSGEGSAFGDFQDPARPSVKHPEKALTAEGRSPLTLSWTSEQWQATAHRSIIFWSRDVHVTAPGHAWGVVHIDFRIGGDYQIGLRRGADLAVRLENRSVLARVQNQEPMLSLDTEQGNVARQALEASDPTVLRHVSPGCYRLRVVLNNGDRIADAEVTLVAGETCEVTLALRSATPLVPLAGMLRVPVAWQPLSHKLTVERVPEFENRSPDPRPSRVRIQVPSEPVAGDATRSLFRWSAGDVLPARYRFRLLDTQQFQGDAFALEPEIEVGPAGNAAVELSLPEPAIVALRIVDDLTGENAALHCSLGFPDPTSGLVQARVPAGPLTMTLHGAPRSGRFQNYERHEVDLLPGLNEITLRATLACGVRMKFESEADGSWFGRCISTLPCSPRVLGPDGRDAFSHWFSSEGLEMVVKAPGHYRVFLPDLPDCEPIPPFEIDVERGKFTEHTVRLTRLR